MPPKKTKPNEKCPCGSGKKHKKCCMIANQLGGRGSTTATSSNPSSAVASSPTAIVDELMEALSLGTTTAATTVAALPTAVAVVAATIPATAANIRPCLHGSTSRSLFGWSCLYKTYFRDIS